MPRILLVEDNDQLRTMLKLLLANAGYEVSEAQNGKEASQLYRQHPFELVITDLIMPEQEGLETIKELHSLNPAVRFIAMTGGGLNDPQGYLHIAQKLGAQRILAKPFAPQEFLEAVNEAWRCL